MGYGQGFSLESLVDAAPQQSWCVSGWWIWTDFHAPKMTILVRLYRRRGGTFRLFQELHSTAYPLPRSPPG
jgi:hypothetical protein